MNLEIANRLFQLRKEHGYSQERLAEKLGISRQAVSKWERAEASPDTDNIVMLAKIYNISLDELLLMVPIDKDEKEGGGVNAEKETPLDAAAEEPILINVTSLKDKMSSFFNDLKDDRRMTFSVPILCLILFFVFGRFFFMGWAFSWAFILLIPLYYSAVIAAKFKNAYFFLYPLIPVILYVDGCLLLEFIINGGMGSYWTSAWVIFFTIPIYYWIVFEIRKSKRLKNKETEKEKVQKE